MKATCPHCNNEIDVVSSSDLEKDYGLNQNAQQHLRERGRLPAPWLEFPNRNVYLRSDIENSLKEQTIKGAEETVQTLMERVDSLPPEMQEEVKKMLRELGK